MAYLMAWGVLNPSNLTLIWVTILLGLGLALGLALGLGLGDNIGHKSDPESLLLRSTSDGHVLFNHAKAGLTEMPSETQGCARC